MSGLAGIIRFGGATVDDRALSSMTRALAPGAPDGSHLHRDGCFGFGHALLQTTGACAAATQPATLEGRLWITADARIDGRDDLVRRLVAGHSADAGDVDDAGLILRAYDAWGPECVEHLLGDFAFAIWDVAGQRLFCARDHFGVKPFYYALIDSGVVFGSTVQCLRRHPDVSEQLNDLAIADFLLFGHNRDQATTTFAAIRRLPPAHALIAEQERTSVTRYWRVPQPVQIRYRNSTDYAAHFLHLLSTTVTDRMPDTRIGVWLSGGIDSTSLAAVALESRDQLSASSHVKATSVVYHSLIEDDTPQLATSAADALGIDLTLFPADDHRAFADEEQQPGEYWTAEPTDDPFIAMRMQLLRQSAADARVWLSGEGADELLWPSSLLELAGSTRWTTLAADVLRTVVGHRRRPAFGLRTAWRRRRAFLPALPPFPPWVNPSLCARFDLLRRWRDYWAPPPFAGDSRHPVRADAAWRLAEAPWAWYFESFDAGTMRAPLETRYPFLDVRLVNYALSVPPLPWCVEKALLRHSVRGLLPREIVQRRKTPLGGDPLAARLCLGDARGWARLPMASRLDAYVDRRALTEWTAAAELEDPWLALRPLSLNHWLRYHDHARSTHDCEVA